MTDIYPWNRDYPIPDELNRTAGDSAAGMAGWRTEKQDNPGDVFLDIYNLQGYLCQPGNLQLRGRRGTGKTIYFLKGQHTLGQNRLNDKNKRTASVYIDLKTLHNFQGTPSLILRAELIYRTLLKAVLTGATPGRTMQRFCLQDYIDEQNFMRRWSSEKAAQAFTQHLNTGSLTDPASRVVKQVLTLEDQMIHQLPENLYSAAAQVGLDRTLIDPGRNFITRLREIDHQFFADTASTTGELLKKLLHSLKIDHLILFIDEFCSPAVMQSIQVLILDRLLQTCDGAQISFKFASVPGTTVAYDSLPQRQSHNPGQRHSFSTFDFGSEAQKKPDVIHTGNFEVFLRNLSNTDNFYQIYLMPDQPEGGFNTFIADTFEGQEDFLEFIKAGEELPRQMLETYFSTLTIRKSMEPKRKLTAYHIQLASRQSVQITYQTQIQGSKKCAAILKRVYAAKSRVLKIEKLTEYADSLALLTHLGFLHACPIPATTEPEISKYPLEYFFTSYRTEIANQLSRTKKNSKLEIDDLTHIRKDKLNQLYPKAKPIILSNLV